MTFNVFVVDDEPKARNNLVLALKQHVNWQNIVTYASGKTLVMDAQLSAPDVIFLDIKMPGENGLALAKQLLRLPTPPLLVFVTAFSDYAVAAFELYAIDYLLKPFDDERISLCIDKLEHLLIDLSARTNAIKAQDAWAHTKPLDKIVIKSSKALRVIPTKQIRWLAANGNYVDIHHEEGKHLLRGSLKSILACLPKSDFIQVHRGFALRISLVRELKSLNDDQFSILLTTGDVLPVGKSFYKHVVASIYS